MGSSFELLAITSSSTFLDLTRSLNLNTSREAIAAPGPRPASQSLVSTITTSYSTGVDNGSASSTILLSPTTRLASSTIYTPIYTTFVTSDTTVKSSSIKKSNPLAFLRYIVPISLVPFGPEASCGDSSSEGIEKKTASS